MSLLAADIADKNVKIKNLSRESYFLRQEISRKRGIARVMQQDMDSELKNAHMKNKLMKKAKKQGLMVALLDLEKDMDSMMASKREINGIGESDTVSDMEDKSYKISTTEKNMNHSVTEEFDDETIATNAVSNLDKDPHIGFPNENSICSESLDELMCDEEVAVLISPERLVNEVQALASSISHFGISATLEMCVNVTIVASEARTKKAVALACTQSAIGIVLDNLVEKIAAENYSRDKKTVAKAYAQNSVLFVVDSLVSKELLHRHEIEVLKQKQLDDIKNARYVKAREVAESVISLSLDEMLTRIVEDKECEYNAIREVAKKEAHDAIMEALDTLIREHSAVDEDSSWQVIARACAESAITTTLENLVSNLSPIKLLSMAYAENAVATVFNMLHIEKEYRSHPRPKSPEKLMSCSIVSSALNYSLTNLGFVAEERPRSPERTAANSFVATAIVSSLSKLSFIALSHDTANKSTSSQFSADRRKFDSAVDEDIFFICEGAEDCDNNNSANFQNNHHPSIVTENISTVDILDIDKFHNSESNSDSAEYSYINNTTSKPDTAFDSSVVFLNGSTTSPQYESENDQYGTSTNVEEGVSSDIFPAGGGCAAVKAKRKTSVGNGDLNNAKPDAANDSSVSYPVFVNGCTSFVRTYLTPELFDSMREKYTSNNIGIYDIINIGLKDSHDPIGLRALDGESYDVFRDIFDPIIRSCQNITPETDIQHMSDCDSSSILRMEMIDYSYVNYFQLQCSRSVSGLLFTTPSNAKSIENPLSSVLTRLRGQFQGSYQSLSTLSHQELSKLDSETLCSSRVKVDGSLGGQGVYFTENREFVVWINTDNHFELMVQQKTDGRPSDISSLFEQWVASENALEVSLHKQEQKYSFSSTLGYLTNSPSNIGTAFHIYFVVKLSQLGKDESALMQMCANLSLRCERFEGDWKISNVITLGKTEIEIVQYVIDALIYLIDCEKNN
jgi:creatine kinase